MPTWKSSRAGSRETSGAIDLAAAGWAAKCDRGELTSSEQAQLEAWAAQDTRHAGAFARAMAVNIAFTGKYQADAATSSEIKAPSVSRRQMLAAAASVGTLAVTGLSGYGLWQRFARETTAKGHMRLIPLADGSTATLNTDSAISIAYDEHFRRVTLHRGEALFDVAKDTNRPFLVDAGAVTVRAVGTSFAVKRTAQSEIGVIMREGIVDVVRHTDGTRVRMVAGTILDAAPGDSLLVRNVTAGAIQSALAWKDGQIDLNQMTIAQAVDEFSRYSDRKIAVEGRGIADLRITGLYPANDPEGFADAVALAFGLSVRKTADGVVLQRR